MKDFIKRHKFLIFWLLISLLYCCTVVTTEMSSIPLGLNQIEIHGHRGFAEYQGGSMANWNRK